jgi:hypothetical protein
MDQSHFFLIKINEQEIDIRTVFYIEIVKSYRSIKKLHLADSTVFEWRTRYPAKSILDLFGRTFFIQISRNYIVNKRHICGRSSNWQYLHLSFYTGCCGEEGFLTQRINVGKGFLNHIKEYISDPYIEIKDNDGDISLINPVEIIYIKLTKEIKSLHLNKSYPVVNSTIEWQTRLSASEIIKKFRIDGLFQVHRSFIINRVFPFTPNSKFEYLFLKTNRKNPALFNIKIPIGAIFKPRVIKGF